MALVSNTVVSGTEAVLRLAEFFRLHTDLPDFSLACTYGSPLTIHLWGGEAEITAWANVLGKPVRTTTHSGEYDGGTRSWKRHLVIGQIGEMGVEIIATDDESSSTTVVE